MTLQDLDTFNQVLLAGDTCWEGKRLCFDSFSFAFTACSCCLLRRQKDFSSFELFRRFAEKRYRLAFTLVEWLTDRACRPKTYIPLYNIIYNHENRNNFPPFSNGKILAWGPTIVPTRDSFIPNQSCIGKSGAKRERTMIFLELTFVFRFRWSCLSYAVVDAIKAKSQPPHSLCTQKQSQAKPLPHTTTECLLLPPATTTIVLVILVLQFIPPISVNKSKICKPCWPLPQVGLLRTTTVICLVRVITISLFKFVVV